MFIYLEGWDINKENTNKQTKMEYKESEVYFLKCDNRLFEFPESTLRRLVLKYPDCNVFWRMVVHGKGEAKMMWLDHNGSVMEYIIRELKNGSSVDWRRVKKDDLILALKYCGLLNLYDLVEHILSTLESLDKP